MRKSYVIVATVLLAATATFVVWSLQQGDQTPKRTPQLRVRLNAEMGGNRHLFTANYDVVRDEKSGRTTPRRAVVAKSPWLDSLGELLVHPETGAAEELTDAEVEKRCKELKQGGTASDQAAIGAVKDILGCSELELQSCGRCEDNPDQLCVNWKCKGGKPVVLNP